MTDAFRNTPGLADQVAQSANVARRSNETGDAFAERLARTIYLQEEQKRIAKIKEEQRQRKETGRFGDYFDKKMFGGSR
ncbi:MAG: hypothetical protein MUC48_26240 [Leptolyngbya sp. Prado105]|nr:hypothetical protein [Leptolyngbya sp. Prado105]